MYNNNADAFILVELLRGEGHGSELGDRIWTHSKGVVKVADSLSRQLRRLEADGLLSSRSAPPLEGGGGHRIIYTLTPSGEAQARRSWEGLRALLGNQPDEKSH